MTPRGRLSVGAPAYIVSALADLDVEAVIWDRGDPPRPDIEVWVPEATHPDPYAIKRTVDRLGSLRVVQLLSAGVEPWPEALPRDVVLCAGKGIHGSSTAEMAVATTLSMTRELPLYQSQQGREEWAHRLTRSVVGERVMVLGAGDVGSRVGAALTALGADVLMVGRLPRVGVLGVAEARSLAPSVQVLVITLPLTVETLGLVDESWLTALPNEALVVNVGRGQILDHDALTPMVLAGRLRAALDVTYPEPLPAGHPLWAAPGAIITPHAAGGTRDWQHRAGVVVRQQLVRLLAGRQPRYVVTAGY